MTKMIPLTDGKFTLVDDEDYEQLNQHKWHFHSAKKNGVGYAARKKFTDGRKRTIRMHRQLLAAPDGFDVDHINGDRLDNRRANLRLCTRSQNMMNSTLTPKGMSGIIGVELKGKKWSAKINVGGRRIHLGTFETIEAAGNAYADAVKKYHGEFARRPVPGDKEQR